jgi:hypothetical protein
MIIRTLYINVNDKLSFLNNFERNDSNEILSCRCSISDSSMIRIRCSVEDDYLMILKIKYQIRESLPRIVR